MLTLLLLAPLLPTTEGVSFELPTLEGGTFSSRSIEGQVTVLEWTSHLCPAVARVYDSCLVQDTRAAVDRLDAGVPWITLDSSWFAPDLAEDIAPWRARMGCEGPYLLDTEGAVARAFGALATPHFFVLDEEGAVVYQGSLGEDGDEGARRNRVLEAVTALVADRLPEVDSVSARGCTLKLKRPGRVGVTAASWDEEGEARKAYLLARHCAEAGAPSKALGQLERALDAGLSSPLRVLSDDAFARMLAHSEQREAVKELLRPHAGRGSLTVVAPSEPGEAFVIAGTVRDEQGQPIPGALVSCYHTDAKGHYSETTTSARNPRLWGRVRTGEDGRYRLRTIAPGAYADSPSGPIHVHFDTSCEGFETHGNHPASLYFADDPNMQGLNLREIRKDGCAILERGRNAEGTGFVQHDIVLRRSR